MRNPNLDPFQVKLIGTDDPLAQAALDVHRRYEATIPARYRERLFGGVAAEEVYIYPQPIPVP